MVGGETQLFDMMAPETSGIRCPWPLICWGYGSHVPAQRLEMWFLNLTDVGSNWSLHFLAMCASLSEPVSCHWEMKRCPLCSFISQPLPRTWYGMRNPVSSSVYFLPCSFSYFRWTPGNIYYIPYSALPLYVRKLGNYVHPAQRAALPFNIYCIPTKFLDRWRIRLKSMEAKKI